MLIICIIPECITEPIEKHLFKNFVFSLNPFTFFSSPQITDPVRIKAVPGPYQVQTYRYGANTRMTRFGYMEGGKIDQETFYSPE